MTELVLMPAACYPVYPAIAARGPLAAGRRHRRRRRRLGLPPRALGRPGAAADVPPARDRPDRRARGRRSRGATLARPRGSSCCARLGLDAELDVANDPFFGRSGRMLAANQREQELKFELLVQIAGPEPTAVASFNYHQDHFAATYGIELADGGDGPHRVPRLRPGADHAGAAARRTGSTPRRGRTRSARSCGLR